MHKLRKNKFFIYLIIIFFSLLKSSNTYVVLPFKIHSPENFNNITNLFNELMDNKLIITLPLGTPQKKVDFFASMNKYIYYLEEGIYNNKDNEDTSSASYNFKESKTFESKKKTFSIFQLKQCYLGQDYIHLYQDINLKSTKEMLLPFYYGSREEKTDNNGINKKIFGQIGFKIDNTPFRLYDYENFISVLKKNQIINSYTWYIHYFDEKNRINNFDGAIIVDIFNPKFFSDFPFLKKDNDYNNINAADLADILAWTFNFEEIYYNFNETQIDMKIHTSGLAFETDLIKSPEQYFDSIKDNFFKNFLKDNICFLIEENYNYIYCEKNSFKKYLNTFPSLYFKSLSFNKTFILNSDDLFKDCGNYYLFMITKPKYAATIWTLGKIFMKKNKFYFDSNKKLIGYFDTVEVNNYSKKSGNNLFNKIKWYIFIVIGIIFGIFIGKKIKEKARKLRANELEDNYEYLGNESKDKNNNDIINTNNNINLENKNISNYREIKSPLYDIKE